MFLRKNRKGAKIVADMPQDVFYRPQWLGRAWRGLFSGSKLGLKCIACGVVLPGQIQQSRYKHLKYE
jgi:tetrahydromethanopterin S-methyltransferase subunit F